MLTVGSTLAGYRIERVLGAGGMGAVYLARNPTLPRYDALKVLSAELSRSPHFRARFQREADVAAQLDHPNIVSVYRRGETDDAQLWIAMQFVDGTDADAALAAGMMTPARAVFIVGEVSKALDYAHRRYIVHRDVKPANILLSSDAGGEERVLLGDFGIARALDDVGLTMSGAVIATLAYAAPEALEGQPIDGRADLYSLGCSLFRLLTGKTPYSAARSTPALIMAHVHEPPPRPTTLVPSLPPAFDTVIATALAKNPAQRFQSGRALAEAASAALNDRTIQITLPWQPIPSSHVSPYLDLGGGSYPGVGAGLPYLGRSASQDIGAGHVTPWWQQPTGRTAAAAPSNQPTQYAPGSSWMPTAPAGPSGVQAPRPAPKRRRWIIAAAVGAAMLAIGATVAAMLVLKPTNSTQPQGNSTSPSKPAAPIVSPGNLGDLFLSVDKINAVTGVPMKVTATNDVLYSTANAIDEKDCAGAWSPADQAVFTGTNYLGVRSQDLSELNASPQGGDDSVTQALIAFPSADLADKFFAAQKDQWGRCANRRITAHMPDVPAPAYMTFGELSTNGDRTIALPQVWEGLNGWICERGMAVRNNVVVDMSVCGKGAVAQQASDIMAQITGKIPA